MRKGIRGLGPKNKGQMVYGTFIGGNYSWGAPRTPWSGGETPSGVVRSLTTNKAGRMAALEQADGSIVRVVWTEYKWEADVEGEAE